MPERILDLFLAWNLVVGGKKGQMMWEFSLLTVIWSLWKERNLRCFDGRSSHWKGLVEKVKYLVPSWVLIHPIFRGFSLDLVLFKWREVALEEGA